MKLEFTPREHLFDYEWDFDKKLWKRPKIDTKVLKELNKRNNLSSALRLIFYVIMLAVGVSSTLYLGQIHILLALPALYFYYFIYGFLTAISHEMRHSTTFTKNLNGLTEILFFIIQTLMWQSPLYERTSHRLHHRYTMIIGNDPETDWPEVVTRAWIKKFLLKFLSRLLVVGAVYYLIVDIYKQLQRSFGKGDKMMQDYCSEKELKRIRIESFAILLIHLSIIAIAVIFNWWLLIVFITVAWQIGQVGVSLYFFTEHLSKMYNSNDQVLATRSVKVGWFVKQLFWGLDDHIEHHIFPGVPSCNLPKLHDILIDQQDERLNIWECWKEIYTVAQEKEERPNNEFVPATIRNILVK